MKTRSGLLVLSVLAVVVVLNLFENHLEPRKHPIAADTPKKPAGAIKGPRGKAGGIVLMQPGAKVKLRVWFSKSTEGHEAATDLMFRTYRQNPGRVSIVGIFGVRNDSDRDRAYSMKWLDQPDEIFINDKSNFTIEAPNGKRHVRFRGFEGKDYSLDDLKGVLKSLLEGDSHKRDENAAIRQTRVSM